MFLKNFWRFILNFLFPPTCLNCHAPIQSQKQFLCLNCFNTILINDSFFCGECEARFPEPKKICHKDCPFILASATSYEIPAVKTLIHYLKYEGYESIANTIAGFFELYLSKLEISEKEFLIIPIPLSAQKKRERGFSQSLLLAEKISEILNFPINQSLIKIKHNKPQAKCRSYLERQKNMQNCFVVKNPEELAGKNIILVDDVFTSGATIREAVEVLKLAGAKIIIALVLAKAGKY